VLAGPSKDKVNERRHPSRPESREVVELRRLRALHADLAGAIDAQIAVMELHRRIQPRVKTPILDLSPDRVSAMVASGKRLLELSAVPLDWSDVRFLFRQSIEALAQHGLVEPADVASLQAVVRQGDAIRDLVEGWYACSDGAADDAERWAAAGYPAVAPQIVDLTLQPFLTRCAELVLPRVDLTSWRAPRCPLCGATPEFASLAADGLLELVCHRCTARWPHLAGRCLHCAAAGPDAIVEFRIPGGLHRLYGCSACHRYLKALDTRVAGRPLLPAVDVIAMLPLDAAAIQAGYESA
jgi:ribosomal protein L40E